MRSKTWILLLIVGCYTRESSVTEESRIVLNKHTKYTTEVPSDIGLAFVLDDLTALVPGSQMRVTMTTPTGANPPVALFNAIADNIGIRDPSGVLVAMSTDLAGNAYQQASDSVFGDPPEARFDIVGSYVDTGWYEARIDLVRLSSIAAQYGLNVVAANADAHLVSSRYLSSRFSHGSRPVVRRVVVCRQPAKVYVDLSEGVALGVRYASDALRVYDYRGGPIAGCPESAETVQLDGSKRRLSFFCGSTVVMPDSVEVVLPLGGVLGIARGDPVYDVSGRVFDQVVQLSSIPGDGQCSYFAPN